jgi:hypothetical protein
MLDRETERKNFEAEGKSGSGAASFGARRRSGRSVAQANLAVGWGLFVLALLLAAGTLVVAFIYLAAD